MDVDETQAEVGLPLLSQLLLEWIRGEESEGMAQANYANAAAIIAENLTAINWAGFYFYDAKLDELILGPFVGKAATVRIKNGNGVVGTAFKKGTTIRVADVHEFVGHIACDSDSNAEIVLPLVTATGAKIGVLDIDSTMLNRFSEQDEQDLTNFAQVLLRYV
ncbi:GAF domain protein [Weissella oryzae SG25]|uniref:GAF domain protein n=1 Tax=Weissella oryzae (strain DSM 25784 / JCM 18191 / LMG 30913 / SG25) TaxID=1329250 RepID=A0A069CU97_WEIOS|nr:GAF domain-containing protein [Weissella oryzae]GAK30977.1 GAF domain protein [Weissella oryzae SG25]